MIVIKVRKDVLVAQAHFDSIFLLWDSEEMAYFIYFDGEKNSDC